MSGSVMVKIIHPCMRKHQICIDLKGSNWNHENRKQAAARGIESFSMPYRTKRPSIRYERTNRKTVEEAHICSMVNQADGYGSCCIRLQVDDMDCQLAPGGYVTACARDGQLKLL